MVYNSHLPATTRFQLDRSIRFSAKKEDVKWAVFISLGEELGFSDPSSYINGTSLMDVDVIFCLSSMKSIATLNDTLLECTVNLLGDGFTSSPVKVVNLIEEGFDLSSLKGVSKEEYYPRVTAFLEENSLLATIVEKQSYTSYSSFSETHGHNMERTLFYVEGGKFFFFFFLFY